MKPKLLSSVGSQHARRVRILLHELDFEVETEEVQYGPEGFGGDDRAGFLAINPNGKVPVLLHGDVVLWESNAIMGYLADLHGETDLWPRDPLERAQVSMWQVWQSAHLTPAADGLFYENMVKPLFMQQPSNPDEVERLTASFHRWMKVLEARLSNAESLALGRFTCADISVASALMHAEGARMPIEAHPSVHAWLRRVQARPSWVVTEPPAMPR